MTSEPPAKKKCLGADCDNDAGALQCPTCLKLGIKDSFFCAQDCFKRNWVCIESPIAGTMLPKRGRGKGREKKEKKGTGTGHTG